MYVGYVIKNNVGYVIKNNVGYVIKNNVGTKNKACAQHGTLKNKSH